MQPHNRKLKWLRISASEILTVMPDFLLKIVFPWFDCFCSLQQLSNPESASGPEFLSYSVNTTRRPGKQPAKIKTEDKFCILTSKIFCFDHWFGLSSIGHQGNMDAVPSRWVFLYSVIATVLDNVVLKYSPNWIAIRQTHKLLVLRWVSPYYSKK